MRRTYSERISCENRKKRTVYVKAKERNRDKIKNIRCLWWLFRKKLPP